MSIQKSEYLVFLEKFKLFSNISTKRARSCDEKVKEACENYESIVVMLKEKHLEKFCRFIKDKINIDWILNVVIEKNESLKINDLSFTENDFKFYIEGEDDVSINCSDIYKMLKKDENDNAILYFISLLELLVIFYKLYDEKMIIDNLTSKLAILKTIFSDDKLKELLKNIPEIPDELKSILEGILPEDGKPPDLSGIFDKLNSLNVGGTNGIADALGKISEELKAGKNIGDTLKSLISL
jgi:hypothetical protein